MTLLVPLILPPNYESSGAPFWEAKTISFPNMDGHGGMRAELDSGPFLYILLSILFVYYQPTGSVCADLCSDLCIQRHTTLMVPPAEQRARRVRMDLGHVSARRQSLPEP